jgi:predicted nuclease of predicted toxin-antitoxin system
MASKSGKYMIVTKNSFLADLSRLFDNKKLVAGIRMYNDNKQAETK